MRSFGFAVVLALAAPLAMAGYITTTSLPDGRVAQYYSTQLMANTSVIWTMTGLPPGLTYDMNGQIYGTPTVAGDYTVHVVASYYGYFAATPPPPDMKDFPLTILPPFPALRITTVSLPAGPPGRPYSAQVSATGGSPPYYFYMGEGGGMLPPGLMLDSNGLISGTPTMIGVYRFTVFVYDMSQHGAHRALSITIGDPLRFTTPLELPPGQAGMSYFTGISASGGVPPLVFSLLELAPQGLSLSAQGDLSGRPPLPGTFSIPIQVADQQGTTTVETFTLFVEGQPQVLQPSDMDLQFTALVGGDRPPAQTVTIVPDDGRPRGYALMLQTGDGSAALRAAAPAWLRANPDSGQVPARFDVSVDQAGLAAGVYPARILVATPGDNTRLPITVNVALTVVDQPSHLDVGPNPLKFAARLASPGKQQLFLAVRNTGGGGPIAFSASVLGKSPWITQVTPASGETQRGSGTLVGVEIDSSGLAVGQYGDVLRIASGPAGASPIDVPVSLFVSASGPLLDLDLKGVRFRIRQGTGTPIRRSVSVVNRGAAGSTVTWSAQIAKGAGWLDIQTSGTTVKPGTPGVLSLGLLPAAAALASGAYYALVRVSDAGALNSPQYVTVVLEVAPSTAPTLLDFSPTGVVLVGQPGSATPQTAIFSLAASSIAPIAFQAASSTLDGQGWLSVTPASGAVSATQTTDITISASAQNLTAGIYRGEIVLARGTNVRSINVTFIVAEGAAADAPAIPKAASAAGCAADRLALTHLGIPNHFSAPAGWPQSLILSLNDNCGRAVNGASVSVSFSNGDPPLGLVDNGTGIYTADWLPANSMKQVNMTVRATAGALTAATALLVGDVTPNSVPILARNGTLHNLNPKITGALSPGLVAQVFGSGLAAVAESTGTVPLVTSYKGTSVTVGPFDAPLYYVSPTQLVVQLPSELSATRQYAIVVGANGALTLPDLIDIVPVEPGVAAFADGRLIAQHLDFTLVDDEHPAKRGEYLTMYLVGLGATSPGVPSGMQAPGDTLAIADVPPTVTIDGQQAPIVFAGLTPGGVGLFQINFQVPASARLGVPLDVVVKQGDVPANTTTLTVAP